MIGPITYSKASVIGPVSKASCNHGCLTMIRFRRTLEPYGYT